VTMPATNAQIFATGFQNTATNANNTAVEQIVTY
jgi:hypothetical protein